MHKLYNIDSIDRIHYVVFLSQRAHLISKKITKMAAEGYQPANSGQKGGIFYWVICISRRALSVIDFFLDVLFGYTIQHGTREERKKSEEYESSAQVVNITARGTYSVLLITQLYNFVWRHERYVHPRYVLEHDNITLMGVTPTHAFFCVSDPDFDVLDTQVNSSRTYIPIFERIFSRSSSFQVAPFLWIAQFDVAKKLVIMPHSSFNRLAAEIGDPRDRKVTFVNMTARCGSTLLGQIMTRTPETRSISEPWSFMHIHRHFRCGLFSTPEYKRLVRSVVRLQCKRERSRDVQHIFMKTTLGMSPVFPTLKELFPTAKFIFNTRNFKPTFESMMQIGLGVPMVAFLSRKPFWVDSSTIERWPQIEDNFLLQNWCECNQAPYDDPFFCDLLKEWKLSGSMFDFNEGIARMAFSYSAQVRKER